MHLFCSLNSRYTNKSTDYTGILLYNVEYLYNIFCSFLPRCSLFYFFTTEGINYFGNEEIAICIGFFFHFFNVLQRYWLISWEKCVILPECSCISDEIAITTKYCHQSRLAQNSNYPNVKRCAV